MMMGRKSYWTACMPSLLFLLLAFAPNAAVAKSPFSISDFDLAESPAIVVAKWDKAPIKVNEIKVDNVKADNVKADSVFEESTLPEYEATTEIEVKRVVKGEVVQGKLEIMIGPGVGWSVNAPELRYKSAISDATATVENVWFLSKLKSRVDAKEYYCLTHYRGVQPLVLESYFKALAGKDLAGQLPHFLRTDEQIVQSRILSLIAGQDYRPQHERWPIRPDGRVPLKEHANWVRSLIETTGNPKVRRHAVAAYGQVTEDAASVAFLQSLLKDEDSVVRDTALRTLATNKGRIDGDCLVEAARQLKDPRIVDEVINRLDGWHDVSAAPPLIEFLQNDESADVVNNEWDVPAIHAQQALLRITDHHFPLDVAVSRQAWATARLIHDPNQRLSHLKLTAPNDPKPWKATFVFEENQPWIEVTNRSSQTLTLAKQPTQIRFSSTRFLYHLKGRHHEAKVVSNKDDVITVAPGESFRFVIDTKQLTWMKKGSEADLIPIKISYMSNGNKAGLNSWTGMVTVEY
jgi:hypothetical protein